MTRTQALLDFLAREHASIDVLTTPSDTAAYETGARYGRGSAAAVVRPASTSEVQALARAAQAHGVRLVAQGANTGLVGGSSPDASGTQVVLSTERLKGAIEIDVINRSATVPAGTRLSELNQRLAEHGLFFPIDLGADPTIGGMIAANTGGARLLKYGDVRHNLLGVEAVLAEPAGEVLDLLQPLRKNNVGFDFKQLFVGTGGAFGIVTAAALQVHPLPQQTSCALIIPGTGDAVNTLIRLLDIEFADYLTSCEGISRAAAEAVVSHIEGVENPFEAMADADYAVLVELTAARPAGNGYPDLDALMLAFLEAHFGTVIGNAIVGKAEMLWKLRHAITESIRGLGSIVAFDLSVPRSRIATFRTVATRLVAEKYPWMRVFDFGHLGDGGIHLNMVWPDSDAPRYDSDVVERLRSDIYALTVREFSGSYSAEHGIGPYNAAYYQAFTAPAVLAHMGGMQSQFDPRMTLGRTWLGKAE